MGERVWCSGGAACLARWLRTTWCARGAVAIVAARALTGTLSLARAIAAATTTATTVAATTTAVATTAGALGLA